MSHNASHPYRIEGLPGSALLLLSILASFPGCQEGRGPETFPPRECPTELPEAGTPCDYHRWDSDCLLAREINCGGMPYDAYVNVICEDDPGGDGKWRVDPPACPQK